jgi:hypothetical protein
MLQTQVLPHPKPWLLRSVRVAVHMRRGDITQNVHHLNRLLPLHYYVNVLQQLTKVSCTVDRDSLGATGHNWRSATATCCLILCRPSRPPVCCCCVLLPAPPKHHRS